MIFHLSVTPFKYLNIWEYTNKEFTSKASDFSLLSKNTFKWLHVNIDSSNSLVKEAFVEQEVIVLISSMHG